MTDLFDSAPTKYALPPESRERIGKLLDLVATEKRPCAACGRTIWFVTTKAGKRAPYDCDAVNHFGTCPEAERFRR